MALWLAKEFDWDTGRYTGNYYDIAEAGIVAKFVDSFYGDNSTGDGSSSNPYKTLGAAITDLNSTGADGSRIFMNGIFSENLPTQTYWYDFIGCGGGKNSRTLFFNNISGSQWIRMSTNLVRWQNIETLLYDDNVNILQYSTRAPGFNYYFLNCFIKNTNISSGENPFWVYFYQCIVDNCIIKNTVTSPRYLYIYGSQNIFNDCSFARTPFYAKNNYLTENIQFPLTGWVDGANNNIAGINAQFINPAQGDYNVRITSPLLGAGVLDEITVMNLNVADVNVGLPYNGISPEFTTEGGATITDLTIDSLGKFTITAPATTGTLETALMDLGNIYPLENIDLFNVFDFAVGEITQGVFEAFSSPRMALTIKLKYGLTSAEVDDCPWLLIEYGKQPTFSGTGASRVGNAADTFDSDTFQTITCRYMKLFVTLQDNS